MERRDLDILVLSDIHLGTRGCEAAALLQYLDSVNPKMIVLNGDIVDIWQFKTGYFPKAHWAVLSRFLKFAKEGVPVHYLTGNHDDALRKIVPYQMGNVFLDNTLLLKLGDKLAWIFHGDIYDKSISHGRWMAKMGGRCYDSMIVFNRFINRILKVFRIKPWNFSKWLKSAVKKAVQKVNDFEQKAIDVAIEKNYDYVICGHVHRPQHRKVETSQGTTTYLNSGDWLENCSALEYADGQWELYIYKATDFKNDAKISDMDVDIQALIQSVQNSSVQDTFIP